MANTEEYELKELSIFLSSILFGCPHDINIRKQNSAWRKCCRCGEKFRRKSTN